MEIEELASFTPEDLRDLDALMHQLSGRLAMTEDRLREVVGSGGSHLFVAREEGRIVGCATLCVYEATSSRKGVIEDVVVLEEYRGRHIGRMLVGRAMEMASSMSPIEIQLTSKPHREAANALYRSLGFERVETNCYRIKL